MNDNIVSILKDMPVTSWHFFDSDGGEVGKLEWANGTISFVGNADESAKRFFEIGGCVFGQRQHERGFSHTRPGRQNDQIAGLPARRDAVEGRKAGWYAGDAVFFTA